MALFQAPRDNLYLRVLDVDLNAIPRTGSRLDKNDIRPNAPDYARVWYRNTLVERTKGHHERKFKYPTVKAEAVDCFTPPRYLMNVGFATLDPTSSHESNRRLRKTWFLPELLQSACYTVHKADEHLDGDSCLVVKSGRHTCDDVATDVTEDKLWFDRGHGLALRKRELRVGDRLIRVVNWEFAKAHDQLWIPMRSRIEFFSAGKETTPVFIQEISLASLVVNQVPPDFFHTALTKQGSLPESLFDKTQAYHWSEKRPQNGSVTEVWAVDSRGRRMEIRKAGILQLLRIDTSAWSLIWMPTRNRATLLPSRLKDKLREDAFFVRRRDNVIRLAEQTTAVISMQEEQLDERKAEKLTAYYPADPAVGGNSPIHEFDPALQREVSGTEQRTRVHWFASETGLMIRRRCGCKRPKWRLNVDYPHPDAVGQNYFSFDLPDGVHLTAANEELKRVFLSSPHTTSSNKQ